MRSWTKAASLLFFLPVLSVYPDRALSAEPGKQEASRVNEVDPNNVKTAVAAADPNTTINRTESGTFDIDVSDADIAKVLRMLALQSQKNIIASKGLHGAVSANLRSVTFKEALEAIVKANGYAYREKGNFIYVYTAVELADIEKSERQMTSEVFHLYYTPADNVMTMLKPMLSPEGQMAISKAAETGIETGGKGTGGNTHATDDILLIKDYADVLDKVRKVIKDIDRRPQQILIEATILRAALTEDNALGIDFTVLGGVDFAGLTAAGSSAGEVLSGAILGNKTASGVVDKGAGAAQTGLTGGAQGVPAGGLRVGVVKNNLAMFLSALETTGHTHVMANPKILALNKQKGEVIVGKKTGYLTTTLTESTAVQSIEFLETGTRLVFRPFIGDDGYIRMEVHPEDSDGGLVNNLPVKTTTEITSNVMIKDGYTVVIGGLFRESNEVDRGQVPFLGDLPFAGPLFRRQADSVKREEIIILLTPKIVKDDKGYSEASLALANESEKLRVGVRKGMMWTGRERLAETAYDRAVEEMAKPKPNTNCALWNLDCATNLNPTFIEAIDLKQKITGKQVTSVDNSSIRDFVKKMILADQNKPATNPTADLDEPTTRPFAAAPATRPSTQPMAQAPTTEQVVEVPVQPVVNVPTTSPVVELSSTQPAAEVQPEPRMTSKPFIFGKQDTVYEQDRADDPGYRVKSRKDNVAATQPAQNDKPVTELPVEEIDK